MKLELVDFKACEAITEEKEPLTVTCSVCGRLSYGFCECGRVYNNLDPRDHPFRKKSDVFTGDIFVCSWGYDQTNIDFYKVIEITKSGKTAKLQQLKTVLINGEEGFMCGRVMPGDSDGSKPITRRVAYCKYGTQENEPCFGIASYSTAFLWDGKPEHQSWYA